MKLTEPVQIPNHTQVKTVSKLNVLLVLLSDLYRWFFILPDLFLFWLPMMVAIGSGLYSMVILPAVHTVSRLLVGKEYVLAWELCKQHVYKSVNTYAQSVLHRAK